MPEYTQNEIIDILLILGEAHCSCNLASRLYRSAYPDRRVPNPSQIRYLEQRRTKVIPKRRLARG